MQKRDAWYTRNVHACIPESISCYTPKNLPSEKKEEEPKKADPHPRGGSTCTAASCHAIIAWIKGIASPHYSPPDVPLATINNPAILDQLQCPVCLMILCQPLELSCRALVCTTCTVEWFIEFKCIEVKCP